MTDSPLWVRGLRSQLAQTLGPAWRVYEQRGKTKLDVRFNDGSRQSAVLPYPWLPASARGIQDTVESVAADVAAGLELMEAVGRIRGTTPSAPLGRTEKSGLMEIWERFGDFKRSTGAIKPTTWQRDYYTSAKRLEEIHQTARNAKELLTEAGRKWPAGGRRRQIAIQHIAAMLRWGCDEGILQPDLWTPPSSLRQYVGEAPPSDGPAIPLTDLQILELLDALPRDSAGQRWIFVLRLLATYGLRPVEAMHLETRQDGKLWCVYQKRSGGGTTKPRALAALHPEWESAWQLRESLAANEPMPPFGGGVAEAARRYLKRQPAWAPLAAAGITCYGFRHGYALRAHKDYALAPRFAAALMGHSVETHQRVYGTWTDADTIDSALQIGLRFRDSITRGSQA